MTISSKAVFERSCRYALLAVIVAVPGPGFARTWHVPGEVPTIQGAINMTQAGDDVLIAPGTYPEYGITMKGGILVHSEQGPAVTIVDPNLSGVAFVCSSLAEESTIEGLRITRGNSLDAGGINCISSPLLVRDCWIDNCQAWYGGGGIRADGAIVRLENCRISDTHGGQHVRGGIYCLSGASLTAESCVITDNWGFFGGVFAVGGGLHLLDCQISDGGQYGVYADSLEMKRCVVTGNGPMASLYLGWKYDIEDCLIAASTGEAIEAWGTGRIAGCTIVGSQYLVFDGYPDDLSIERTIIAFNNAAVFSCPYPGTSFRCCDSYGNQDDTLCGADLGGNFSADPMFCGTVNVDYTLNAQSPCLPGHNPGGVDCGLVGAYGQGCGLPPAGACCLPGGSCVVEQEEVCAQHQGTYQGDDTPCDPDRCTTSSVDAGSRVPSRPSLYAAPNPSAAAARIVYDVFGATNVTIEVFNAGGSLIRRFPEGVRAAGRHVLEWDGRDGRGNALPSGVYMSRILTEEGIATTRLVLTR